jgi:hypothetical protein
MKYFCAFSAFPMYIGPKDEAAVRPCLQGLGVNIGNSASFANLS